MAHAAMVDCYLHHLLEERFEDDVTVRGGLSVLPLDCEPRVRVVPGNGHALRVEVSAALVSGVGETAPLFATLNQVNAELPYGRVFLLDDIVVIEHTVAAEDLTGADLDGAIRFVVWVTECYGHELAEEFGGCPPGSPQMSLGFGRGHDGGAEEGAGGGGVPDPVPTGGLIGASAGGYL